MPSLVKLYNEFKERDFVVLAVDIREKKDIVKRFAKRQKISFPVLLDKEAKVANSYGIRAHPTHFLINGEGEMIGVAKGGRDWANAKSRNLVHHLLEQNKKKWLRKGRKEKLGKKKK